MDTPVLPSRPAPAPFASWVPWPALLAWATTWTTLLLLDGQVDIASLSLLLVLGAAVAAVVSPPLLSLAACAAAVLAFNWTFVPPRGSFSVDLHPHALLLLTMAAVSTLVALLVVRQRRLALQAGQLAEQARQLRALGETLRDSDDPIAGTSALRSALEAHLGGAVTLLLLKSARPAQDDADAAVLSGPADADMRAGLWLCLRQSTPFGPGSGRHEEQPHGYLPMRGRQGSWGAAVTSARRPEAMPHAQALCDQMGQALERAQTQRQAAAALQEAQAQKLRNTLLAAISHDHRTPLATILGAASSLHDQGERLSPEQRRRLAARIVDETTQLARLTDNTLQLARLDTPGLALRLDWESAEELIGAVLRRVQERVKYGDPARRVNSRVEPGLPLLRCDAVLLVQLLDNLLDNALKYSDPAAPVELLARRIGDELLLAVRDRGPGVPLAQREHIFEVFQRGSDHAPRGAGVGLAVCRAIARAHGGQLRLRPRGHGGSSFECTLPIVEAPSAGAPEAAI